MNFKRLAAASCLLTASAVAQHPSATVESYIRVDDFKHTLILDHVRVIDGTGAKALEDRSVVIMNGQIAAINAPGQAFECGAGCWPVQHLDLTGDTVFPGLVGMHDHLYYIARPDADGAGGGEGGASAQTAQPPLLVPQMTFSAPRMYLAAGVTTLRTTGSVETYADLNLRHEIETYHLPGPHLDVTGPYLEGAGSPFIQMHPLRSAEEAAEFVDYWAKQGVTSFKAYMNITRAELKAAIDMAHTRGLKVTGHLCSVTYPEAAELGIDDLEHGFFVNTQLDPGKQPDVCPRTAGTPTLEAMDPGGAEAKALIALLVAHHVAVTSTLPVFEGDGAGHPVPEQRVLDWLTPEARAALLYTYARQRPAAVVYPKAGNAKGPAAQVPITQHRRDFFREMELERRFVAAGGLLLAGPDPTGDGHVLPGFGDQREVELLVDAGFTPLEAIRIATLNGATYMGRERTIGSLEVGKNADMVVVKGDPSRRIADIENVEMVFRDGVGYDSAKLLASVKGRYGQY